MSSPYDKRRVRLRPAETANGYAPRRHWMRKRHYLIPNGGTREQKDSCQATIGTWRMPMKNLRRFPRKPRAERHGKSELQANSPWNFREFRFGGGLARAFFGICGARKASQFWFVLW